MAKEVEEEIIKCGMKVENVNNKRAAIFIGTKLTRGEISEARLSRYICEINIREEQPMGKNPRN